ncbi:hypothetical protein [Flavobacterium pectinovorum]|uniref:MORN repeat variant n=1 Tax=Flavobacterium pectinovorum TaxID=29533 RepID=A0A502EIQ4_9FLAO|nr:hypothetical protein [Flavobacterium pectinovorum]TPG37633.1 hypothetical protein EAH81_19280 [Flavobacterium pectinovorum]
MSKHLLLIIILFSLKIYSQEIVSRNDIYAKDSIAYKVQDNKLFTGKVQNFKHKTHLVSEIEFVDGILNKTSVYANGKEVIILDEDYYYEKSPQIKKKVRYSFDHKIMSTTYYEKNGNKKLEEELKDGILVYSCPYTNNKKNGKLFSIDKKGEKKECVFENGKLIKNI